MSKTNGFSAVAAVILLAGASFGAISVSSFEELCKIGVDAGYPLDGEYELAADIDASGSRGQNGGAGFAPIGKRVVTHTEGFVEVLDTSAAFRGSFDGKGFRISGLYVNRPSPGSDDGPGFGLFGFAYGARIRGVAVDADTVLGYKYVGAVVGRAHSSVIEGCYAGGVVSGLSNVGGLAGGIEGAGGVVASSYSAAAVSGTIDIGGLVGSADRARVVGCYSLGPVAVAGESGRNAGGLVGSSKMMGVVSSCYSMSRVSGGGASAVGGLVGDNSDSRIEKSYSAGFVSGAGAGGFVGNGSGAILYSYLDTERSGHQAALTGVTGRTSAEMARGGSFTWNFNSDSLWAISNSYPYLKYLPLRVVTITATPGGTVGGGSVCALRANDGVDPPAVAAEVSDSDGGESFEGWYLVSDGGAVKLADGAYGTFTVALSDGGGAIALSGLTGDADIEARFAMKTYRLTYVAGANGQVRADSAGADAAKDTLVFLVSHGQLGPRVRAVPNEGYRFSRWTWRDTSAVRADTAWGDTTFEAKFVGATLTLRYGTSNPSVGRLRVNDAPNFVPSTTANNVPFGGTGPKVEAVPMNDSCFFRIWSDSVTSNPRVDSDARDNVDALAIFAVSTFTLTYTVREGGKIAAVGYADTAFGVFVDTVEYNKSGRRVTAVPDSGYVFVKWDDNDKTDSSRVDSLVRADISATALFERVPDAVKSVDRVIPNNVPNGELTVVRPLTITAGEFTAGPNPVSKPSGPIIFFWNGRALDNSVLLIYDVTGHVVGRIAVVDNTIDPRAGKRKAASWNLTDGNGKPVPAGTYLVKGTLLGRDGVKENVALVFGIR